MRATVSGMRRSATKEYSGRLVAIPKAMSEYLRERAYLERIEKNKLVSNALYDYLQSEMVTGTEYEVERPFMGQLFLRLNHDQAGVLESYSLAYGLSQAEIIRRAIQSDRETYQESNDESASVSQESSA